jgi:acetyl-CoA C-acetyltransferase
MESMTNAPHLLMGSRTGTKYGTTEMLDHMAWDGLTNPYDKQAMGVFGEKCVQKYGFTREEQDAFAAESVRRAQAAVADGSFKDEIAPVTVAGRKGDVVVDTDEHPGKCDIAKIPTLRPAFAKDGTITAASSSSINDGAAALVLMSADAAKARGAKPLARVVAHATNSQAPEWFPPRRSARSPRCWRWPAGPPTRSTCSRSTRPSRRWPWRRCASWASPHDKLNVHGGACALGHPIGPAAPACWSPDPRPRSAAAASAAWPRCASAAARRRRWRSSWPDSGRTNFVTLCNRGRICCRLPLGGVSTPPQACGERQITTCFS